MNGDQCTGGDMSLQNQVVSHVALEFESVSGDRWAPGIETVGSRSTGAAKRRSAGVPASAPYGVSYSVPERALRKRRLYLKACLDELGNLRNADDDPIHSGNALAGMKSQLQSLWELVEGNPDSEAFEEIINVLQVALCVEGPEALKPNQLDAISSVLLKLHDEPDLNDQTANDLTSELVRGGIDVFREIG
jgi:hypothetical protein